MTARDICVKTLELALMASTHTAAGARQILQETTVRSMLTNALPGNTSKFFLL